MPQPRRLTARYPGLDTSDGAGVRLTRIIGQPQLDLLDPFLLFDAFRSADPGDYLAGFPPHPHRGFETVTYLLAGRMRHRDSAGHSGLLQAGGVQWMSAGRGVIHEEMPEQEQGLLHGFQLWVNLPAAQKMSAPHYQELGAGQIPIEHHPGSEVRVIAGTTAHGSRGPIQGIAVDPLYLDISLAADAQLTEPLPPGHNGFIYLIEGALEVADSPLQAGELGVLGAGDGVTLHARQASRLLLIAGRPLGEPIARRGPFVMNTQAELMEAFRDYTEGRLAPPLSTIE